MLDSRKWSLQEIRDLLGRQPLCLMEESLQGSARREVVVRLAATKAKVKQAEIHLDQTLALGMSPVGAREELLLLYGEEQWWAELVRAYPVEG